MISLIFLLTMTQRLASCLRNWSGHKFMTFSKSIVVISLYFVIHVMLFTYKMVGGVCDKRTMDPTSPVDI